VIDPNAEWIGNLQPTGLVVAANVLARHGLNPAEQTRADTETARTLLSNDEKGPALVDPWSFFTQILGWRAPQVAGTADGPALPVDLSIRIEESAAELAPHWAVSDPDKYWQLLVRLEGAGVQPDHRGALQDWEATPHQQLERLLRETGVPTGLLLTDNELRVVHAPRGETSGWLKFPLRSLGDVGGRPMLGGLKLILSSFRLHNDAPDRRLTGLLKESREAQAEVSSKLAAQVLGALHELLRALHSADRARIEALAASRPSHVYEGLLTVLLRLVFLLYAEDRDLIPSRADGEARALYDQGYGVRPLYARLLDDAARYPDTMDERRGAWARLLALFRLVQRGDGTGWIRGRGGKLFDPDAFPFLQGQDAPTNPPAPATVSDGSILRILDLLLNLDGEQLSYRTLDVEQIGSVYETVMGFTVQTLAGPAIAIRAGKNDRTPVFVDLAALAAKRGAERARFLKEEADRNSVTDRVGKPLAAAADPASVAAALRPIVDERASPGGQIASPGTPLLQPTDERRRTGSHYTPRSLTEPIVRHALEPAFERLGPDATPEQVLDLKVCDPAMGSGAFLVEACRALAARLVEAWARHPGKKPVIPPDEDEDLHARRLVAQRCVYGVDKNPLATDLAKLSLWLATLARDHEFTFLDHVLKSGDSLVGLTQAQVAAAHWDRSKPGLSLFRQLVSDRIGEIMKGRTEIQAAPDGTAGAIQELRHRSLEGRLKEVRLIGDAVIAAFFAEDKPKARERKRATVESWLSGSPVQWDKLTAMAATLRDGTHSLVPFHWEIEFPEVYARANGGFDAIVGNPPFLGGTRISTSNGLGYRDWLVSLHSGCTSLVDLVAHFFRRSFANVRQGGAVGMVATNTISQGDTRAGGLGWILRNSGTIYRATRRLPWPGAASVVVSIIHITKSAGGRRIVPALLNEKEVERISAFLFHAGGDENPKPLASNEDKAFLGSKILGIGFLFDDENAAASPLSEMHRILEKDEDARLRVKPYLGGEEFNKSPTLSPSRYVIDFGVMSETEARSTPELFAIIEAKVKPARQSVLQRDRRELWWLHSTRSPELAQFLETHHRCIAMARVSRTCAFAFVGKGAVLNDKLVTFLMDRATAFSILQSRAHELWARFFSSTMKDDLQYTPTDCFDTFPFPARGDPSLFCTKALEEIGGIYHDRRAALMVARNEGLTKTYNRFHDPTETSQDIQQLRELHASMDRAALEAYGWHELAARAAPIFLDETNEDDHAYQGRLFWRSDFRAEVLARLLALNTERHNEEISLGIAPRMKGSTGHDYDTEVEEVE
jgi:hypothetical protein